MHEFASSDRLALCFHLAHSETFGFALGRWVALRGKSDSSPCVCGVPIHDVPFCQRRRDHVQEENRDFPRRQSPRCPRQGAHPRGVCTGEVRKVRGEDPTENLSDLLFPDPSPTQSRMVYEGEPIKAAQRGLIVTGCRVDGVQVHWEKFWRVCCQCSPWCLWSGSSSLKDSRLDLRLASWKVKVSDTVTGQSINWNCQLVWQQQAAERRKGGSARIEGGAAETLD